MATYLALMRWTKEGIEKIKESPSRLDAAKKATEAAGALKLVSFDNVNGLISTWRPTISLSARRRDLRPRQPFLASKAGSAMANSSCFLQPRTNTGRSFQASPDPQGVVA